ncbi:hypothetical protein B0H14DRAFT_3891666 [Mycena olivaceomarginata]|nr:hypothetical protein B0H14DRAFT_3891666 [Mycena olivaceomarginata]
MASPDSAEEFHCDCAQFCKSVRQPVSRTTWYRHAPYRNLLRTFDDHAASLGLSVDSDLDPAIADLSSPKKRRNNGGASSRKRRRLASPANSDPAPSSQDSQRSDGFATMLFSDDGPQRPREAPPKECPKL